MVTIDETLSHYRIVEELGHGGMGVVYRARDTHAARRSTRTGGISQGETFRYRILSLPGTFFPLRAYLLASGVDMRNCTSVGYKGLARFLGVGSLLSVLALAGAHLISRPCSAQEPEKEGAGLVLSGKAGSKDVGLPIYPDSKPHKDDSNDSQSARLGLWGGGSGFKLALVKMDTVDSPEKVAAFYKKALAKYGKVLDCSDPSRVQPDAEASDSSKTLTCGDDKPEKGGMLFKSGTKEKQHIVSIQPNGQGSFYQLVNLTNWSKDDKN